MIAALGLYWKQIAIGLAALAVVTTIVASIHSYGNSQYALGAAKANEKFQETIEQSKGLIRDEKDAVSAAASAAARRVCNDAGLDPSACEDL